MNKQEYEVELTKTIGTFKHDPVGFIKFIFPWGKEGTPLEHYDSLDTWQEDIFNNIHESQEESPEDSLQYAISSGH